MQSPTWIRARDLDQWATSPKAKLLLPELIGRLVRATVPPGDLTKCDFPAEAETHRPGYDGTTVTTLGTLYVPSGVAYWELGCDARPENKAQADYQKRVEEHEARVGAGVPDDISEATFIAVTPRDWHDRRASVKTLKGKATKRTTAIKAKIIGGMAAWTKTRTDEKRFRAVEAYDSSRLEQWLREAPAVALWLAKEMGKTIACVRDIGSYWLDVQAALKKPLPPNVLLVNRASIAAEFNQWQTGSPRELAVRAPSAVEVVAVFAAWVHSLPPTEANAISARTIIIEDRETWRALASSASSLILIAAPRLEADRELLSSALRNGHFVLRHADFRAGSRGSAMELERMRRFDLQQALEDAGLDDAEARKVAQAAGGNFTILRRIYARSPEVESPQWSKDTTLAALLLAGSWEDERPGDGEMIERLTKRDYADAREIAAKWRFEPDAPLRLVAKERGEGKTWEFLSPLDAWESLRWSLNPRLIATFEEIAVEVLTEDDPGLSLPPAERPMAAIKGLVARFSHNLRQGIAEILAVGATREDEGGFSEERDFARHAASVVRRVLPIGCRWQRWASLGGLLSSLVEAAPDEFLAAVEHDLASPDPQTVELMRQEVAPSGLGGAAYHTGILWALETAAWPSVHLHRVASILAQLTERDPGGKWTNRPLASATALFFPLCPQTVAFVEERIDALQMLYERWPAAAWRVIVALMPTPLSAAFFGSSKPTYRDWAAGWTGEIAQEDYLTSLEALADLTRRLAVAAPSRWGEVLDKVSGLCAVSKEAYEIVRDEFQRFVMSDATPELREVLWQKLREIVHRHTCFRNARWALPPEEVARWAALRDHLAPSDPVVGLAHLFATRDWDLADESLTHEQKLERRAAERRTAIRTIFSAGGITKIKHLAEQAGQPREVGWSLGEEAGEEAHAETIPSLLNCGEETLQRLAGGFAAQRIHARGVEWAESVPTAAWSVGQIAAWSIQMPFGTRAWDWVASHGGAAEGLYWQQIGSFSGRDLSITEATRAFKNYLGSDRAWDALQFLVSRKDILQAANTDMLCTALEAVLADKSKRRIDTMDGYYVREALSFLQKLESQADESRVARLEFAFLPLLDNDLLLPETLHRRLARDPGFFVECLFLRYRSRDGGGKSADEAAETPNRPTNDEKERAQRIWQLLHDWQIIPGTNKHGVVAADALRAWVVEARKQAEAVNRRAVCDFHIGNVFAQSPTDVDKGMPLVAIRDVVEECKSEEIESGFCTGLRNLRGTHWRGFYEGGKQERELSAIFEQYAQLCSRWPRTARALRAVAKDYLREANLEDERASARE